MIDVHAHFAEEGYEFPAEWEKIQAAGVNTVILAADTLEHAAWHAKFCEEHEGAFFTVGVHPEFAAACPPPASGVERRTMLNSPVGCERAATGAQESATGIAAVPAAAIGVGEGVRPEPITQKTMEALKALAAHAKCVAVGEIGLDYHYGTETKEAQKRIFEAQLEAADRLGLPVQIHSRDACADTLEILRAHRGQLSHGFVMHCYSYGAENLTAFADLGAYFSFGGTVCFKNARRAVEAAEICPAGRLLTETDSPYLSPFRGEKNTPANIPVIVQMLAEIRGENIGALIALIEKNAKTLFKKME